MISISWLFTPNNLVSTGEMFSRLSPKCLNNSTEIADLAAPVSIKIGRFLPNAVPVTESDNVWNFSESKDVWLILENCEFDLR